MNPDSMTQVLSHARKITCAGVQRMRGLSVVFTLALAYQGIAIACERNTLFFSKKYHSPHLDVCDHEEDCHHEDGCHSEEEELGDGFVSYHLQPVFGSTRSKPSSCQAKG